MSDDEEVVHSEEETEDEEEEEPESRPPPRAEDEGPSEAELAMARRAAAKQVSSEGLDEYAKELLAANLEERQKMEEEIQELRERTIRRKAEREEEEKRITAERAAEDAQRKAAEEERNSKKRADEESRREARAAKMAEFEKWKNPSKPNFVITKREDGSTGLSTGDEADPNSQQQSKEQLAAEKRAILSQRIHPLDIAGFDEAKLAEKAKQLHKDVYRAEGEKYDLEKRSKALQYDMMELAERARNMNKVGGKKGAYNRAPVSTKGGLKRVQLGGDDVDKIQERFSGAPAKIEMFSKFERQHDKRSYDEKHVVFRGDTWKFPAARIDPKREVRWDDDTGLPIYEFLPGFTEDDLDEEPAAE